MGLLFFSCRVVKVKAMNNARHVGNYNNVYIYVGMFSCLLSKEYTLIDDGKINEKTWN